MTKTFRLVGVRNEKTGKHHLYITNVPRERLSRLDISRVYAARRIPLREGSPRADGTVLQDKLSKRTYVVRDGHVEIEWNERAAAILVPA